VSPRLLRNGVPLLKKRSARDLSTSESSDASPSQAPLLRKSRSMIFELAALQKENKTSPTSTSSSSSQTAAESKKDLISTFRLFDRKLLMRKMSSPIFSSTEGTADEELRVLSRSVSDSALTYLFGMEPGPVRTSTGLRRQGALLWEVEKSTTKTAVVRSFPRPRAKTLPDNFRFYSPDADPIFITRERRMTITTPTISSLFRMRALSLRKGSQELRFSHSRTQSMGSQTSSEKPSEGNHSDDEEDVQREVADARDLVETLKIDGDPLTMPIEEVTKRMAQEEKEDFANVNFDEETGCVSEGTLRALIRQLIVQLQDVEFLDAFMLTYDIFVDSFSLLKAMLLLYRVPFVSTQYLSMFMGRQHSESMSLSSPPPLSSASPTAASTAAPSAISSPTPTALSEPPLRARHESIAVKKEPPARRGSSPTMSVEGSSHSDRSSDNKSSNTPNLPRKTNTPNLPRKRETPSKSTNYLLENVKAKRDSTKNIITPPLMRRPSDSPEDLRVHGRTASVVSSVVPGSPGLDDPVARQRIVLQFRLVKALAKWLELRYEKLRNNKEWNKLFNAFLEKLNNGTAKEKTWANMLQNAMKEAQNTRTTLKKHMKLPLPHNPGHLIEFLDIPLEALAQQMTLLEQKYFFRLKLRELANRAWTKPDAAKLSPNVHKMIEHFNQNSYWVATTVVLVPGWGQVGPKQRAQFIARFIQLMEVFAQYQNYNGILQIYSALNMSCVERLKKAWSFVPQKYIDKMKEYGQLVSNANNYRLYREKIEFVEPPAIPLQEVLLRDLFFIDDRNENVLENGWINFSKMVMLGKVYEQIRRFQKVPYNFKEDNAIQWYLKNRIILSEDDLFLGSKNAEPKRDTHEMKMEAVKAREHRKRLKQIEKKSESPEKVKVTEASEKIKKNEENKEEKRKRKESEKSPSLKTTKSKLKSPTVSNLHPFKVCHVCDVRSSVCQMD